MKGRPPSAVARRRLGPGLWVRAYLTQHARAAVTGIGQIGTEPFTSFLTAAVIGIALALPAGLHVLLANLQSLTAGWQQGAAQISLYLKPDVDSGMATVLAQRVGHMPGVGRVRTISREQALEEFRRHSGFSEALDLLKDNPLPAVVVVTPAPTAADPAAVSGLVRTLRGLPEVELAQSDMAWLERLGALLEAGRGGVEILGMLLAVGVLLIVGNTIRMAIENRREEIEITKLSGATDAFVRRPFLYRGLWYGLCGGIIAWTLVYTSLWGLNKYVAHLSQLYGSAFRLGPIDPSTTAALLGTGALLGLTGTWLAVGRHLKMV